MTDPFGPKAIDPLHAGQLGHDPLRAVDVVGSGQQHLAVARRASVSTEAESSGMAVFAHELSHNLSLPDNYDNPFACRQRAPPAACGT